MLPDPKRKSTTTPKGKEKAALNSPMKVHQKGGEAKRKMKIDISKEKNVKKVTAIVNFFEEHYKGGKEKGPEKKKISQVGNLISKINCYNFVALDKPIASRINRKMS